MEKYKIVVFVEVDSRDTAMALAEDAEADMGCMDGVNRDSVTVVVEKLND